MTQRNRGLALLAVQLVLVLSIAGKYVYERKACPRVWVRTAKIDPNLTMIDLDSLDTQVAANFTQERLIARLTTLFGILALVLASIGLYGITAYQVARRTSEIGLRMALGANRANVVGMVLRGAFVQVGLGLVIGVPVAILGARAMSDQLYKVRSYDPLSLIEAVVVLSLAATLAGFIPARRAASIDPMKALRTE